MTAKKSRMRAWYPLLAAALLTSACVLDEGEGEFADSEEVASSANELGSDYFCATVRYWDSRSDRSDNPGSKLTFAGHKKNVRASDVTVFVMHQRGACIDADASCTRSDYSDLRLRVAVTDSRGFFCVDGISSSADVYLMTNYEGHDVDVMTDTGARAVAWSNTRWNVGGSRTMNWNITCPDDAENTTPGMCNSDGATANGIFETNRAYANILMTMNQATRQLSSATRHINGHTNRFKVYYPDLADGNRRRCKGEKGSSWGFDRFCIGDGYVDNNHAVLHELGHNIMRRALNHSGSLANGTCGSSSDWWVQSGSQKCAVSEGWADFFAGALSWHPNAERPWSDPRSTSRQSNLLEGKIFSGNAGRRLACVSMNNSPEQAPGNVARWFWDLFDSTTLEDNHVLIDNARIRLADLVAIWSEFDPGTLNRQNRESGAFGRNAWDYRAREHQVTSELYVNCLSTQKR